MLVCASRCFGAFAIGQFCDGWDLCYKKVLAFGKEIYVKQKYEDACKLVLFFLCYSGNIKKRVENLLYVKGGQKYV